MKIYLVSAFEPQNLGTGKIYAIISQIEAQNKQYDIKIDGAYPQLTPSDDIIKEYRKIQLELSEENKDAQERASKYFTTAFYEQCKNFYKSLHKASIEENISMMELLPFKDGDSLVSNERFGMSNYRSIVAGVLKKIGYEVILK